MSEMMNVQLDIFLVKYNLSFYRRFGYRSKQGIGEEYQHVTDTFITSHVHFLAASFSPLVC